MISPRPLSDSDLSALIRCNRLRGARPAAPLQALEALEALEARFEADYGSGSRLAVYGTLAPGRSNHREVERLKGKWISGLNVRGHLFQARWRAQEGYPALRWSESGTRVPIQLLICGGLDRHWGRLDAFEGPGYRRILVPVRRGNQLVCIANLYESVAESKTS